MLGAKKGKRAAPLFIICDFSCACFADVNVADVKHSGLIKGVHDIHNRQIPEYIHMSCIDIQRENTKI